LGYSAQAEFIGFCFDETGVAEAHTGILLNKITKGLTSFTGEN
jgi:hypothetical protein